MCVLKNVSNTEKHYSFYKLPKLVGSEVPILNVYSKEDNLIYISITVHLSKDVAKSIQYLCCVIIYFYDNIDRLKVLAKNRS